MLSLFQHPEKFLLNKYLKSKQVRDYFVKLWSRFISSILQFHLSIVVCYLATIDTNEQTYKLTYCLICISNFIIPILLTVLISFSSSKILLYVEAHKHINEPIVDYIINNWTKEKVLKWKRISVLIICIYVIVIILFTEINNYIIFISTLQTMSSFYIGDIIEHKIYKKPFDMWKYRPTVKIYEEPILLSTHKENVSVDDFLVINDYNTPEPDYELITQNIS